MILNTRKDNQHTLITYSCARPHIICVQWNIYLTVVYILSVTFIVFTGGIARTVNLTFILVQAPQLKYSTNQQQYILVALLLSHFVTYDIFPQIPTIVQKGQLAIILKGPHRCIGLSPKALNHNYCPSPQNLRHINLQSFLQIGIINLQRFLDIRL